MDMDDFRRWLQSELARTGKSQSDLARHWGIQPSYVSKILNSNRRLSLEEYASAVAFFQTPESGRIVPLPGESGSLDETVIPIWGEPADEDSAYLREHYKAKIPGALPELDVQAGAGEGTVGAFVQVQIGNEAYSGHRVLAEWKFPDGYLRNNLKVSPHHSIVMEVRGDSMDPKYRPGDKVIVDLQVREFGEDGVYLISDGHSPPRVKRLEYIFRSSPPAVKIISDNPAHRDDQTIELDDLVVMGRIAGRITVE